MNSDQRVIALAGLSGAGKTTLVRNISGHVDFSHFSASDLIKEQIRREEGREKSSENLRSGDIPDNQSRLVEAYRIKSSDVSGHVILDCHTIIDTPNGLQHVPASTFKAIGITDFLFLKIDPGQLFQRRSDDISRSRPHRNAIELEKHQEIALQAAREIAETLDIPFIVLSNNPKAEILSLLEASNGAND